MLVIRTVLLVGFALNILGNPDINHLLTVTVLTCLLVCTGIRGSVYKKKQFYTSLKAHLSLIW